MDGVTSFYSYKGGSGRTTTLSNIAALLATKYNVACIDLDIFAPGLGTIFNITDEDFPEACIGDYFKGLNPPIESMCVDLTNTKNFANYNLEGRLFVFPYPLTSLDPQKQSKMSSISIDDERLSKLLIKIQNELLTSNGGEIDFILLDSPSGFTNEATMYFMKSNFVVNMLRYSEQHIMGTMRARNYLTKIETGREEFDFITVFNSIPLNLPAHRVKNLDMIKQKLGDEATYISLNDRLLWKDEIIVFDVPSLENEIAKHKEIMSKYYHIAHSIISNSGYPDLIEDRWAVE